MKNDEMSFEKKIEKAKTILEKLMQPEITLSESVKAYEEGIKELNEATKMLENAQLKVQKIQQSL